MSIFKIDDQNEIYYEYVPPKNGGFTCVFVNALTGDVSAWNGSISENLIKNNIVYLLIKIDKASAITIPDRGLFHCLYLG